MVKHPLKKVLSFTFVLIMIFFIMGTMSAFADNTYTLDGVRCKIETNADGVDTVTITGFNNDGDCPKDIIIPKEITYMEDGVQKTGTITRIGNAVFSGKGLESVTFAADSEVTTLGSTAFSGNPDLVEVVFPTTLTTMGSSTFANCSNLVNADLVDTLLEEIPSSAFQYCSSLKAPALPSTLTEIGSSAFYSAGTKAAPDNFGEIVIPSSVTAIGDNAFNGAKGTLDLTAFEPGAFGTVGWDAYNMIVEWDDTHPNYYTGTDTPFVFNTATGIICGFKPDFDPSSTAYAAWDASAGKLTIPASIGGITVNGIMPSAFNFKQGRTNITELAFDDTSTLTEVPARTFFRCSNLGKVTLASSITTVGNYAFHSCNLTNVAAPGVTTVGTRAFASSSNLAEVHMESSNVTSIATDAFVGDTKLLNIYITNMEKDSVANVPWNADYATIHWKNSETTPPLAIVDRTGKWGYIPEIGDKKGIILEYLGDSVDNLVVPAQLTSIGNETSNISTIGRNDKTIVSGKEFETVTISDGITSISQYSFRNIPIDELDFSQNSTLKTISYSAFNGCGIETISAFPDSLNSIGDNTFTGNNLSGTITLPGNITSVLSNSFNGNDDIERFEVMQYKEKESDPGAYDPAQELYKKAPAAVITGSGNGFGVKSAPVYFRDSPRAVMSYTAEPIPEINRVKITFTGYTNNTYYIVTRIEPDDDMPAVTTTQTATEQGETNPTVAYMLADKNGTYTVKDTIALASAPETDITTDKCSVNGDWFHTITYEPNAPGGTTLTGDAPDVAWCLTGAKFNTAGSGTMKITNPAYSFVGWNTEANGTGESYPTGSEHTMPDEDMVLYAQWEMGDFYMVNYEWNGDVPSAGVVLPTDNTKYSWHDSPKVDRKYTASTSISGSRLGKNGTFKFSGWSTDDPDLTPEGMEGNVTYKGTWTFTPNKDDDDDDDDDGGGDDPLPPHQEQPANHIDNVVIALEMEDHFAYIAGYPDGTFQPNGTLTRVEAAMIFYRLLVDKSYDRITNFTDVANDHWAYDAIQALACRNVISGYPDGSFRPEATITRAEFCTMASCFFTVKKGEVHFNDVDREFWYYKYIASAAAYGWINDGDGAFYPDENIIRADAVVLVNNMLERKADESFVDENLSDRFSDVGRSNPAYYAIMEAANGHLYTRDEENNEVWSELK